jgi:predicted amidohydrolase YtcJ
MHYRMICRSTLVEETKEPLESGKLADVVLLDANPLKVRIDAIKDIIVLGTIKEGSIVFKKNK